MIKHAILVVVFLVSPAFGVIIDDFSVGPIAVAVDWDNRWAYEFQTGLNPNAVIGGSRIIRLTFDSVSRTEQAVATVDTISQTFNLDVNVGLGGYRIQWGGDTTQSDLALNGDLLVDGSDAFHVDVMASAASQTLRLDVLSGVNEGTSKAETAFLHLPASNTPFSIRVLFSDFSRIDFHDVDYIRLSRTTVSRGQDLTLGGIRTVPEPSTLVTFILGLIGVMWRR